ncbi:glycosyltransferase family 2 protein [Phycicoccus sp.]|uniref:glycosyltransferase family 2 protein n=1 Tax=Phycicoccus sp. TaxID=1902410 RepID=UPI002CBFED4A|nr:glycosyltransferase family 2 protein [Phycicoccus sp.]HMM93437.1 glycosyltransferase family 2 protein [Phycicoccus sp.]
MTEGEPPQLLVVTVTWNSREHLEGFAESLARGAEGLRWHLVVADNASSDGTPEAVEALEWPVGGTVEVLRTGGNLGYAGGINAALRVLPPDLPLLVTNPDVRYTGAAVTRLFDACASGVADIAVPVQVDGEGTALPTLRRAPSVARAWGEAVLGGARAGARPRWGEMVTDPAAYRRATVADWASGSVLLVAGACRRVVEPWDERYFLYSEETDLALRAKDAGFRVRLVPDAVCTHLLGDSHRSPGLWALLSVNRVRLFRRRHGPVPTAAFRLGLVVGSVARLVATRDRTHAAALRWLVAPSRSWPRLVARLQGG